MVLCEIDGTHEFRVYLPQATAVDLVGAFTNWRASPIRMIREHTGWWFVRLELPPGDHDFSYLVDGSTWLPDYAASGVRRNSYGGWVSQVAVPSRRAAASAAAA